MENSAMKYDKYRMKPDEFAITLILAMGFFFVVGHLFYDNIYVALIMSTLGVFYIPVRKKELVVKRKELLKLQFKDALYFISVSLSAGKSFETALSDAQRTLEKVYPDAGADIIKELELINARIMMNIPVEHALNDLAERSRIEEIKNFADVFSISKRAGANLVEIIKNTSSIIREKIDVKSEIENLIAGKKLEQKILSLTPFVLVFILKSTSGGFMECLFTTDKGLIVMTAALGMIIVGFLLSKKIMSIEV